jgi:hypothetical protein
VPGEASALVELAANYGRRRPNTGAGTAAPRRDQGSYVEGLTDPQGIWVLISRPCRHSP